MIVWGPVGTSGELVSGKRAMELAWHVDCTGFGFVRAKKGKLHCYLVERSGCLLIQL